MKIKNSLLVGSLVIFLSISSVLAQDLKLRDLKDVQVNLADYKGKQPVMFFFWTTWCPYCRVELEKLNLDYAQIKKAGIALLAIDIGESSWRVNRFVKSRGLLFNVLLDEDTLLAEKYGVVGVPTFVLLNKKDEVVYQGHSLPGDYVKLLK